MRSRVPVLFLPRRLRRAALLTAAAVAACTPELDWREVRVPDTPLVALFPCRPSQETRQLKLADTEVAMTVLACHAGGALYAVASADVRDPGRVVRALEALQQAATANIAGQVLHAGPAEVPGMTPQPQAQSLELRGQRPDGAPVEERLQVFAKGTRAYQAVVLAPQLSQEAVDAFVAGLRLP